MVILLTYFSNSRILHKVQFVNSPNWCCMNFMLKKYWLILVIRRFYGQKWSTGLSMIWKWEEQGSPTIKKGVNNPHMTIVKVTKLTKKSKIIIVLV